MPIEYQIFMRPMTLRDLNTLTAQYLENSWRCYIATIAILLHKVHSLLRIGYPSDSLASCCSL